MDESKEERYRVMNRLQKRRSRVFHPDKDKASKERNRKRRQQKTRDAAAKNRPWTREEYAAAYDMTRTDVEIALAIGRTAASIAAARSRRPDLRPANYVSKGSVRIDEPAVEQTVPARLKLHTSVVTAEELQKDLPTLIRHRKWTDEERIALFDSTKTDKEIATALGRNVSCIRTMRRHLSKKFALH